MRITSWAGDELLWAMFNSVNDVHDPEQAWLALQWWNRIALRYGNDLFA